MDFLTEPHSMRIGQKVLVSVRGSQNECYQGTIYNIINRPMNRGNPNTNFVDHFYITFAQNIYFKLLLRGSEIIYNRDPSIVGSMTNLTLQSFPYNETTLNPDNINAMLVWRHAYNITPLV
uniref:Uncharacterized protein n=1 Tax=viral metagenome TaxID=1070528 RepID=A0A6C0B3S4_9ZZZZ